MSFHRGIFAHVVCSTKYRKRLFLDELHDDLFAYIGGTIKAAALGDPDLDSCRGFATT